MSAFNYNRLVAAAICVAGFLAQGNVVAGPNQLGASYCTNGSTFIVNEFAYFFSK